MGSFFVAFSAGGSGSLERIAVLRYEPKQETIVNLMPYVAASNDSDWAMWSLPERSSYPILVHADFVWGEQETHFSPHLFTVEAWVFDPDADRYRKLVSYRTRARYDCSDNKLGCVLRPEQKEILRHLEITRH